MRLPLPPAPPPLLSRHSAPSLCSHVHLLSHAHTHAAHLRARARVFTSLSSRLPRIAPSLSSPSLSPSPLLVRGSPARSLLHSRLRAATGTLADLQQHRDHSGHHHHGHGHGHGHSHGVDPYLTSRDKTDPGVRITRIGLYVNLAMVVSKGIGGWVFNSQALVADAFHALTDMVSDIMTLATVAFALKPPTERFPNGYGKIESLGSLGVSSLLFFGGVAMGYASLLHLLSDFAPALAAYLPHMHAHEHGIPDLNAAWLAAGSIVVKEWLYRATMKIAISKKSSVLASNAIHHRVDSLTAIIALLAIGCSNIFPTASWLDPVGGLLVSAMVMNAGWGNTRQALEELADSSLDEDAKDEITAAAQAMLGEKVAGAADGTLRSVEGIKSGQNYIVDLVVSVKPDATAREMESLERRIRDRVGDVRGVWRVKVRFLPQDSEGASEFVGLGKTRALENGKAESPKKGL